jgi:hypothetical protein
MKGSIWFCSIPIASFVVIRVLAVSGRRGRVRCSSCVTPMSARRRPLFRAPWVFGGWVCPHCGARMDRVGRSVEGRDHGSSLMKVKLGREMELNIERGSVCKTGHRQD